jgi:hypothetical protein
MTDQAVKDMVHVTHCCARHGCKYGDTNCPVVAVTVVAIGGCEACDFEREELEDFVALTPQGFELLRSDKFCEEWNTATEIGAASLVFYRTGIAVINTAPYTASQLEWIAAKTKLLEITHSGGR